MDRIVQLTESEYNKLKKDADATNAQIEERAKKMYEEKGIYGIVLDLSCDTDYRENIRIHAGGYVKDLNSLFPISDKDKKKVVQFVTERVKRMMRERYGKQIDSIDYYNKRLEYLKRWHAKFIGFTIFGWIAALSLLIVSLIR